MIETLLGGLLGGAFRLAPEILKWLDRQGERGHELAMQGKAQFMEAGGERFAYLPCLNADEPGMDMLESLVRRELAGWL